MPHAKDLLNGRTCKLKRMVPHPNSFFMDVKCPGCYKILLFINSRMFVDCLNYPRVFGQFNTLGAYSGLVHYSRGISSQLNRKKINKIKVHNSSTDLFISMHERV